MSRAVRRKSWRLALSVICVVIPTSIVWGQETDLKDLQTAAEASGYQATATHDQVVSFIDTCVFSSIHVSRLDFGLSVEGRPMVSALVANPPFDIDQPDDRLRILLLGNIHSGECAGKEALLEILRELARDSVHPWLEDCVFIIAPNYNVDANERIGPNHRPGQVGPAAGMGQRENSQQLDLNREFIKLDSPEARSLVSLIDQFDPHLFVDCHTTNGSRHRYVLTYDIPHNPSSPQPLRDFMRQRMMPAVTSALESKSIYTFYYGNFSNQNQNWTTYGHEPRYSTEYVGLRGRLGVLSEAYSYATYRERIDGTRAFVSQCVEFVKTNADDVRKLLADIRREQVEIAATRPNHILMHLDSRVIPFDEKVTIRGYEGDQPKDYEVTFVADYEPVISVEMPFCYLLPKELSRSVGRLLMHGIIVEQLKATTDLQVELNAITNVSRNPRSFQGHNMVRVETETRIETQPVPAGTFVVRTNQPLGRLASYMLEPESNDGLVTWNFLDRWLNVGADFPILQVRQPVVIESERVTQLPAFGRLALADIFGPDKLPLTGSPIGEVTWIDAERYLIEKYGRHIEVNAATGAESLPSVPWERNDLRDALEQIEGLERPAIGSLLRAHVEIVSPNQTMFLLQDDDNTILFNQKQNTVTRLHPDAEVFQVSPAGHAVSYVTNGNLYVITDDTAEPRAATQDGGPQVLNGILDWVYQEELYGRGNFYGHWWSPNSSHITFLRLNEEPVYRYTVSDRIPVRGRNEVTPYPKAGDPLPDVAVGIYSMASRELVWADLQEYNQQSILVSQVGWSESGEQAVIQIQDREQLWLDLCLVDPVNGRLTRLFRDQTPAWIESPGNPVWLSDGGFLWLSPRDGFRRLCRYDSSGQLVAQFPQADWEIRSLFGVSADETRAFVTGCPESPISVQVLSIALDGSGYEVLTGGSGNHNAEFNDDFTMFIDTFSTINTPTRKFLRRSNGSMVRIIDPNLNDYLAYQQMSPPEFVQVPLAEGGMLHGMLIKPPDFDPSQKYPVLVHVYAGPQAPRVRDRFMGDNYLWHQYLAQNGYVIWMCDNRSASYAGLKYTWPIHNDLGRHELADLRLGLEFLKAREWVDTNRIGIWGWSYGGYMTAYAMTHDTQFAAGISGAPVTDWRNYDAIYTERLMGTPQNNPKGYESSSVLEAAENLSGRLLLIHGTIDDNVHISNTMQLVYELQEHGKQFDLMVYPRNRHSVRDEEQRLHLYQLMTDFVFENL